jgi:hypothetical protein
MGQAFDLVGQAVDLVGQVLLVSGPRCARLAQRLTAWWARVLIWWRAPPMHHAMTVVQCWRECWLTECWQPPVLAAVVTLSVNLQQSTTARGSA